MSNTFTHKPRRNLAVSSLSAIYGSLRTSGFFGIATPEVDCTFKHEERLMHDTTLFVFKGRPADEDQEAVIEFADQHGMAVILVGRAVTLITDRSNIATLFKLTFGGSL